MEHPTRFESVSDFSVRAMSQDLKSTVRTFFSPVVFMAGAFRKSERRETRWASVCAATIVIAASAYLALTQSARSMPPQDMLLAKSLIVVSPGLVRGTTPSTLGPAVEAVKYVAPAGAKAVLDQVNTNTPPTRVAEVSPAIANHDDGGETIKRAAEEGDPAAMHKLAFIYLDGVGGARDNKRAFEWFSRAADAGYAPSQCALAALFQGVNGWETSDIKSYQWLLVADQQGGGCTEPLLNEVRGRIADEDRYASERRAARFVPISVRIANVSRTQG